MEFDSLNKVISESRSYSIFVNEPTTKDLTNPIYHYTSPLVLLGILDEEAIKLQFTRYDCVNDKSEGNNVLENYIEACNQLYKSQEIDEDFYNIINLIKLTKWDAFSIEGIPEDNIPMLNIFGSEFQAYICCFSKDSDSLPMWNYYSKNGHYQGYSLGLSNFIFLENERNSNIWNGNGVQCSIGNVIYENDKKINDIKYWIKNLYKYKNEDDSKLTKIQGAINNLLLKWHLFFKSECFAHENEMRAVIYIPNGFPLIETKTKPIPIEYRTKGAYIIPFITVSFSCKEYLSELVIGPLSEKEISQSTIKSLIEQRDYKVKIKNSEIPIRF